MKTELSRSVTRECPMIRSLKAGSYAKLWLNEKENEKAVPQTPEILASTKARGNRTCDAGLLISNTRDFMLPLDSSLSTLYPTPYKFEKWSRLLSSELQVSQCPPTFQSDLTFVIVGGIGQPLSLLLKINPLITEVRFWYRTLYSNGALTNSVDLLAWPLRYCQHPWWCC